MNSYRLFLQAMSKTLSVFSSGGQRGLAIRNRREETHLSFRLEKKTGFRRC